ncbi:MAG: hypothetical protein JXD23_09015 [Spirochaetales bacterium]|nr:hypothetical protein [Spirochaetales bacterium]
MKDTAGRHSDAPNPIFDFWIHHIIFAAVVVRAAVYSINSPVDLVLPGIFLSVFLCLGLVQHFTGLKSPALIQVYLFVQSLIAFGLIVLFRERADVRTPVSGFLSANCFGVYCFHAPILVAISMALAGAAVHPLAKTALVEAAIVVSSLFAALVQKTPGLRKLFA